MKNHHSPKRGTLILTVACALIGLGLFPAGASAAGKKTPAPAAAKSQEAGRLIIVRSANLGQAVVGVSVDGVQTAKINFNGRYDAPIAAGQHVLTVVPIPNREFGQPSQTNVTVQPGKTYTFTAKRDDVRIVLK